MKRPGPLLKMTLALVALCSTLVMLADLLFGVLPDRAAQTRELRRNVAEALAVQVATLLQADDRRALELTLSTIAARNDKVSSLGIRRADGQLVMQSGDHPATWRGVEDGRSRTDQVSVPLNAGGKRWGAFEIAFRDDAGNALWQWLNEPLVVMLIFVSTTGTLVFGLYMRRALQHLDPASVIPERVQGAFDAMAEGVAVLDARGRVLLANQSFRNLHAEAGTVRLGHSLSQLPWLAGALPRDPATHPWSRAMAARTASAGDTLELDDGEQGARRLVVNCAPITDPGGGVRGCLTTFNDVSELHRTNQALLEALSALSAAKDEVQNMNEELRRLATRDPLTGCLNRRAFNESFGPMFELARTTSTPLSCVMLDIDHFKKVNDSFGHAVGDRVIQEVAKKLHESTRSVDLVCRYGGEEFCVVVPGLDLLQALAFAERVRAKVERECSAALRDVVGVQVRISLGVEVLTSETSTPDALIDRADQGLYVAKRGGRNRVWAIANGTSAPENERSAPDRDALTDCLNQRGLDLAFEAALREQRGHEGALACIVFGVDAMKPLHDAHGGSTCDRIVGQIGRRTRWITEGRGAVARVGPEEFAVLAPGLSLTDVTALAEHLRMELPEAATAGIPGALGPRLTFSFGVDALAAMSADVPSLFDRADGARLQARRAGGDQVCPFVPGASGNVESAATENPG